MPAEKRDSLSQQFAETFRIASADPVASLLHGVSLTDLAPIHRRTPIGDANAQQR